MFHQTLPKQLVDISSTTHGTKLSKARITVFQCLNATGTDVLTPLIIGKAKQPRCFINNQYTYNRNDGSDTQYEYNTNYDYINCERQIIIDSIDLNVYIDNIIEALDTHKIVTVVNLFTVKRCKLSAERYQ